MQSFLYRIKKITSGASFAGGRGEVFSEDFKKIYEHKTVAETIDVLVSRKGILKSIKIELTNDKKVNYKLEKMENSSEKQQKLLKKWLLLT